MKGGTPAELRRFVQMNPDVEAVLQRCGVDTYDLVLVDPRGVWTRGVFPSEAMARDAAADLDVPLHEGWDDERLGLRFNRGDPWGSGEGTRRAL